MKVVLKLFTDLFHSFPWHFVLLFMFVFIQTFLNALSVIAIAPITDILLERSISNSSQITQYFSNSLNSIGFDLSLLTVFIFFGSLTLLNGFIGVASQYAQLRIKYDVLIHLLTDTIGKFFHAKFLFFSQGDMGKLLNSFQQEVAKIGDTFGHIAKFIANFLQALIFLAVPFTLSPKITIIFLSTALILTLPLWLLRGYTYGIGKRNTETANIEAGVLYETLTAAKLILGFGRQDYAILRYHNAIKRHSDISIKFQTLRNGLSILFFPFGMIAVLFALYLAYTDGTPFSEIAMVMFAFMRLMPIIGLLIQGKTIIEGFTPAYEQLENLRKDAEVLEEPRDGIAFKSIEGGIQFKNVSFNYPDRKSSLKNINLDIHKGKLTALVGKSGAGKTTLIDLILGLYQQNKGKILLDYKELSKYDLNSYRQKVGYVPQDAQLFNTTVRENMLWSSPEALDKNIWEVLDMCNAKDFVQDLPEGLETILGDRGTRLSGGQRQRLALARAMIRNPDLLILDEATSSLDSESEKLIQQSIDGLIGKITIVIIAHRLSTISNADYVYVLDKGKLIEKGSYKILSQNPKSELKKMILEQSI